MQVILVGAAIVNQVVTGETGTTIVLIGLTIFNVVLGLRQEAKAQASLAALEKMLKDIAWVRARRRCGGGRRSSWGAAPRHPVRPSSLRGVNRFPSCARQGGRGASSYLLTPPAPSRTGTRTAEGSGARGCWGEPNTVPPAVQATE